MKPDDPSTQQKTEDTRQSTSNWWPWVGPKEYRVIGDDDKYSGIFITIFMSLAVVGFFFWTMWRIQCGADCLSPNMVLYNNTGSEIEIDIGGDVTVVEKDSSGMVDQPVACRDGIHLPGKCQKWYEPLRIGAVNKESLWLYEVVSPPADYKRRANSFRGEYHYQIEADGTIYLLEPDSEFPAHKLPAQPPGFPMVPIYTWGKQAIIMN